MAINIAPKSLDTDLSEQTINIYGVSLADEAE